MTGNELLLPPPRLDSLGVDLKCNRCIKLIQVRCTLRIYVFT
jgi:hypothetical protein